MTTDAVGGVWTYSLELAAGLAARGVETSLVVLGPAALGAAGGAGGGRSGPQPDHAGPRARMARPAQARLRSELRLLRTLERAIEPDLVHVNGFREAACGWRAPVLLVAHSCVRSWWRACRGEEPPAGEWAAYLDGVRAGLEAADAVVAPTAAFLAELQRLYGAAAARPRAIHNGRRPAVPAARRKPFVLAAGRLWDEAKDVAALAAVADELPWPVMVAGEAGEKERRAGLVHLGLLPEGEVLQRMAEAEIFVAPVALRAVRAGRARGRLGGCGAGPVRPRDLPRAVGRGRLLRAAGRPRGPGRRPCSG